MKIMISQLLGWILWIGTATASVAGTTVYMKVGGDDKASGRSQETAVATLRMAVQRVLSLPAEDSSGRRVVVLPGKYLEQTTVIRELPDDKPLVITGSSGANERPVFDGNGKGRLWLQLQSSAGKPTRLTIEGMEVANYVTAVSLNGERASQAAFNGENIIRLMVFRNIGQIAFPTGGISTAAVRLVNSRDNKIIRNQFINIRNVTGCGALHAIYLAHYSSGNLIEDNVFDGGCGAAIKTRDASGGNTIRGNRFSDQSEPLFLDSFCNKNDRDDCTKETNECPSWSNEFKDNVASRLGPKASRAPTQISGPDNPPGCPPPPPRAARLLEATTKSGR